MRFVGHFVKEMFKLVNPLGAEDLGIHPDVV